MAAGHGGQVLLSEATVRLLDGVETVSLGEHRLKDLLHPEPLHQLRIEGLAQEFPPPRTLENRPTNLPTQPTPFLGRERELAELLELLAEPTVRLLTLTGPGGIGKTRLARQLAAEVVERFPQGVYLVTLAPVMRAVSRSSQRSRETCARRSFSCCSTTSSTSSPPLPSRPSCSRRRRA